MPIRLNKCISDAGICSRREADRKIRDGRVRVNGRVAALGDLVSRSDAVLVDGNPVEMRNRYVYLAYHKPAGVTSTTDASDPDNIIRAVGYPGGRIFPVGRLDKDSEGLILLTDDGDIVNKILRAGNRHDKEYIVSVDRPVTDDFIGKMSDGVSILGVMTRRCKVEKVNAQTFRIVLNQGLNRQIRRMCEALGYTVTRLQRMRVMHIRVDGIAAGTWRFLTDGETETLLQLVSGSVKEAPRSAATRRKQLHTGKKTGAAAPPSSGTKPKPARKSSGPARRGAQTPGARPKGKAKPRRR